MHAWWAENKGRHVNHRCPAVGFIGYDDAVSMRSGCGSMDAVPRGVQRVLLTWLCTLCRCACSKVRPQREIVTCQSPKCTVTLPKFQMRTSSRIRKSSIRIEHPQRQKCTVDAAHDISIDPNRPHSRRSAPRECIVPKHTGIIVPMCVLASGNRVVIGSRGTKIPIQIIATVTFHLLPINARRRA